MAEQKRRSQAERAAYSARSAKSSRAKSEGKQKQTAAKKEPPQERQYFGMPARMAAAGICLVLFIIFIVIAFQPEGVLIKAVSAVLQGILGKMGFLISIPALLYLFFIFAFSGKRPVLMRSICVIAFTVMCGCIYHLAVCPPNLGGGVQVIGALYSGGAAGTTGGVLCGGLAMVVHWLFSTVLSYIIFIVAAVMTLLGAMQITIPSIIRAIRERPRAQWEQEEPEPRPEPAAIVVNHIATKRIEYVENRRKIKETREQERAASKRDMLRQIEGDISTPVAAAAAAPDETPVELPDPIEQVPQEPKPQPEQSANDVIVEMPQRTSEEPQVLPMPEEKRAQPEKVTAQQARDSAQQVAAEIAGVQSAQEEEKPEYCFPPISLLKAPSRSVMDGTAEMRENSRRLNETLESFRIEAHIINVTRGPSVTRYEVELDKGVRLNKLTTAANDIALSLGVSGVRIAAVPGKMSVVGIEVPNKAVTMVPLREVVGSAEFTSAKSKSSFAVGKDISGSCIVGNIAKLPHMLIAGTTGSGKSVCMNSIIISLLYKAGPDDVKLIMVDPKMVELGIYNGIPHLLIPVVTDPKKAAGSLQWAVTEMLRRYRSMSDAGVRDLESYNSIIESQEVEGERLPQIVVIIDELADLMLVAAKEVEESICRIAQMGRAAGIHLIIATQRPSADVITGLMKANIPSRIAFAVASAMESRIILDTQGAEKLVGKGDMLYAPIGSGKPQRIQGCFVSDGEVEAVASYVKEHYATSYDKQVMEEIDRKAVQTGAGKAAPDPEPNADELGGDEMLPAAVDVILETGQASVSMLQRRLKLGYARAARIVDEMEERRIVGPFQGSKPRAILVTKEQWEAMRSGQSPQMGFDDLPTEEEPPEV